MQITPSHPALPHLRRLRALSKSHNTVVNELHQMGVQEHYRADRLRAELKELERSLESFNWKYRAPEFDGDRADCQAAIAAKRSELKQSTAEMARLEKQAEPHRRIWTNAKRVLNAAIQHVGIDEDSLTVVARH